MAGKYQSLTIKRKLEILDTLENLPPGKKKKDVATDFNIPASTLSTILKNKDSIRASHALGSSKKKRMRDPTRLDVDSALFQWFTEARAQGVPISGEILRSVAEQLSYTLNPAADLWTCSSGWLSRWKQRHNIKYKVISGENAAVDKAVCEDWKKMILQPILQRYDANDVFNADETGLYWRLLPDKTHAVAGDTCSGGKKSKERVTVLICTNMTGTEKCPLLTIGKFKNPRCFRNISCLPTHYEANKNAWMTAVIFENRLRKWNAKLSQKRRKIVLFLDNCSAHPHVEDLEYIELVFLPPNTTSEIQPCDQGIIKNLKAYYRKDMVRRLITSINHGATMADFKITLLDGLRMIKTAWDQVTSTTIANCFCKSGFTLDINEEEEDHCEEIDLSLVCMELDSPTTFSEYISSDDNLQCSPILTFEEIVNSIRESDVQVTGNDHDDLGEPLRTVSSIKAHSAFLDIKAFLLHAEATDHCYNLLSKLEMELMKASTKCSTYNQTSITDYFETM